MQQTTYQTTYDYLPPRVGVIADVHGELRALRRALLLCRELGVTSIAVLGDLFDRVEEADRVAEEFDGWDVFGVYGNHEREVALAAAAGELTLDERTTDLLSKLQSEVVVSNVRLTHAPEHGEYDPLSQLFNRTLASNGSNGSGHWITFSGHTHVRHARTEHGPLDISRGRISLVRTRRYHVNPGALSIGQFAIWDREEHAIHFHQLGDW
jgi:predicted phosphodiesterase